MKTKLFKKGFSLVELLVVITIIAILSVVAYTAVGGQTANARNAKRQEALAAIQSALEIYFIENNSRYPDALADLQPTYMPELPSDPIGGNYGYAVSNPGKKNYIIATTLENQDGTYQTYTVGNGGTVTLGGVEDDGVTVCADVTVNDGADCFPYIPQ